MNAQISESALAPPPPRLAAAPVLRTIVICDLADSTAIVEQLGDADSAELMRRHDRLARDLLRRHDGREIDKTDGFLMLFDRPIGAVAFALDYQRELHRLAQEESFPLRARVGIHVGDVVLWQNADADIERGAKPVEAEGLVKSVAARVTSIARPGQILLSGIAMSLARRAQGELGTLPALRWHNHGNYRFKGVPEVVPVYEVGEDGVAPFKSPAWTGKAHREVPWWRRPGSLAVEAAVLLAAIAIPAYFSLRTPPAIAFAERDWVVVGDLRNLTADANFNDSLQSAFRIGLEQSRYVNVLSDLKARETLKLMQRDPDKTPIDRDTGSEIAVRDGVRALILPSIAEIGGRVRVTAEVVDPHTQTTVYSESADGIGESSVLPSLDKVNAQLRVRLGEALTSVTQQSKPLEQVATKNLDALRAYTLGNRAYDAGNMKEAIALYGQAVKLDPGFARAYIALAAADGNIHEYEAASKAMASAVAQRERMSARDTLHAEAQQATLAGSQIVAIEKWKMLARLYPDFFLASGSYAYFSWQYANRYGQDEIDAAKRAASPLNPRHIISDLLLGLLYLGNERFDDAQHAFASTAASTGTAYVAEYAAVYAAQRQFERAEGKLAEGKPTGTSTFDDVAHVTRILIAIDRGRWAEASSLITEAKRAIIGVDNLDDRRILNIELALRSLDQSATTTDMANLYAERAGADVSSSGVERTQVQFARLFSAYRLAQLGEVQRALAILESVGAEPASGNYPLLGKMLTIARAEIMRAKGNPKEAVAQLDAIVDGSELYLTHEGLMNAYAAERDFARALSEAQWLANRRGRAYAELNPRQILVAHNVLMSNLAWLNIAEYSQALGDKNGSRTALQTFLKNWPDAQQKSRLAARVSVVQKAL